MEALVQQPHERRVQRFAYLAGVVAAVLSIFITLRGDTVIFGLDLPALAPLGVAIVGGIVAIVATARRSAGLAVGAVLLFVLAVAPAGSAFADLVDQLVGVVFAVLVLAFAELVHMMVRYEKAHRAVDEEGVPEEHIDRVTDEAVKTLAFRSLAAGGIVLGSIILAFILSRVGPGLLRAARETTGVVGVAVIALSVMAATGLYIIIRGGRAAHDPSNSPQEIVANVPE